MAVRKQAALTFLDGALADKGSTRRGEFYGAVDALIPWERLCASIMKLPEYAAAPAGGRPAIHPRIMFKALLLAKWHNLSDQALEDNLADSLSMRRFVGLGMDDQTPDATSFCRFRERLAAAGLLEKIHAAVLKHLDQAGVIVKTGSIVDASIIEAPKGGRRADGTPSRDPEAAYTRKAGRPYFGYKLHIAGDRSGLVTDLRVTDANVHDSRMIDELTRREKVAVYADSAYHQRERRHRLRTQGVRDGIMYQRRRGQAELPPRQAAHNDRIRPVRAIVEHIFGRLKRMVGGTTRFRGLRSTTSHLQLSIIALNIRHGVHLCRG